MVLKRQFFAMHCGLEPRYIHAYFQFTEMHFV